MAGQQQTAIVNDIQPNPPHRLRRIPRAFKNRWLRLPKHTRVVLTILVLTAIAAVVVAILAAPSKPKQPAAPVAAQVCSADTIKKAAAVMAPTQVQKLQPIVSDIKKMPNFDHDPNCLYITVIYYINVSDAVNARTYWDKLKALNSSNAKLSQSFAGATSFQSQQSLESAVQFLEKASKQDTRPKFEPKASHG